jgi:hypothetical protein
MIWSAVTLHARKSRARRAGELSVAILTAKFTPQRRGAGMAPIKERAKSVRLANGAASGRRRPVLAGTCGATGHAPQHATQ